ncbi:MAG: substrate-binding domain-containing protein [Holosporales bacterium]|nr:substrate-binding domain-containing protein [Holosporales bacterium]
MVRKSLLFYGGVLCLVFFFFQVKENLLGKHPSLSKVNPPSPYLIRIVGSDVVFPYAAAVAENFSYENHQPVPLLEAMGTGGGIALFCRKSGNKTPDILMASRALKEEDYRHCQQMGIPEEDVMEIPIGYDGILFVHAKGNPPLNLTRREIFKALSAENNPLLQNWQEVSSHLPATSIRVFGPSAVSGTYESLLSLMLHPFCPQGSKISCGEIRHDEGYTQVGTNQNLLIEKITRNLNYIGIVTFGFFTNNRNSLQEISIEGLAPNFQNLFEHKYPFRRLLYLYLRKSRMVERPEILTYIKEFFTQEAIGSSGYLIKKGLIPLSSEEQKKIFQKLHAVQRTL